MTAAAWGAIAALALFVLTHLGSTIYWAAKITTILSRLEKDFDNLTVELRAMKSSYVSKEEFAYRIAQSDKEHHAMWKRIDELIQP